MVGAEGRHGLAAGLLPVQKLINCFACMPHESLLWLKQRSGDGIGLAIWGWSDAYSRGAPCSGIKLMPTLILAQLAPKCGTIRPESLAQLRPKWVAQLAPDYPKTK